MTNAVANDVGEGDLRVDGPSSDVSLITRSRRRNHERAALLAKSAR